MTPPTAVLQAARRLGIPTSEVATVDDSPAGPVITTADGNRYIDCREPDADGKTGVMFLAPPSDGYRGTFPVYTPFKADEEQEEEPAPSDGSGDDNGDSQGGDQGAAPAAAKVPLPELKKQARELGITVTKTATVAELTAAIAAAQASKG